MQKKYITHWKHSLCNSQKLEFYNVFKDSYTPSIYLDVTWKNPYRKTLVKLRISNHKLNIETGRYDKISRFDRICPVCSLDIEDEIHFLFDCAKLLFDLLFIIVIVKGPLKYLVAKLHGCYPGANSLTVSQYFFARFFRRRPVADSSRCLTFYFAATNTKSTFCLQLFIDVLLYGYNMWVVPLFFKLSCFTWKLHPRTGVLTESRSDGCMLMGKFRKDDSTRFPVSG